MYPWEWMLAEEGGGYSSEPGTATRWVEPMHKVLTGSKALLPVLWQMHPDHPNLLPAYFDAHAAGLGIRESTSLVTDAGASFVPHYLDAPRSSPEQVRAWLAPA